MIDEQRQRISVLQDGELDPASAARLVDALASDPELRGAWERYHLIGLALRHERVEPASASIADAVRRRLEQEPTILAPGHLRGTRASRGRHRVAPFAGIGLAAAAAFMAVFVVPAWLDHGATLAPGTANLPSFASQPTPVLIPAQAKRWDLDRPELADKLDLFLVTHQETAPATGSKGILPYATFVGYEAGR